MAQTVGSGNLIISHMHESTLADIPTSLSEATCTSKTILEMGIPIEKICLLDPESTEELAPEDAQQFEFFLFGGILGDDAEIHDMEKGNDYDRTRELRVLGFPTRHLGPHQMSTDTAVTVTKIVIEDQIKLNDIPYIDRPEIFFNKRESVMMPFRYVGIDASKVSFKAKPTVGEDKNLRPLLPPGMFELLKRDNDFDLLGEIAEVQSVEE